MNPKLIIWDLDGTLVDSLSPTFSAINEVVERYIGKHLSPQEIMSMFGPSELEIVARLVGETHAKECMKSIRSAMLERVHEVEIFEGIIETLTELQTNGFTLGLFTGRGRESTQAILSRFHLHPFFVETITSDEVQNHKPHPEGIYKVCKKAGINTDDAIMVGDSIMDMRAGRSAGTFTVGCLWDGFADRQALQDEQASLLIEEPREIINFLKR